MIIKQKDSLKQAIQQLEAIAKRPGLPHHILDRAQVELRTLKAGITGENNAAYFINFDYGESKNYAVIHDLRIEHQNRVAQIDHLIISRFLHFFVLESKSFCEGTKITDRGEFLVEDNSKSIAIESPIEQTRRHAEVLQKLLNDSDVLPTRLGITLTPTMIYYVLVSPKSRVVRPAQKVFDTNMVIKADDLTRYIDTYIDKMDTFVTMEHLAKMVSSETLMQIGRRLVALHKPASINYYEKYGVDANAVTRTPPQSNAYEQPSASGYFCFNCRKSITKKVATFCFDNKKRFGGKAYCLDCQKSF